MSLMKFMKGENVWYMYLDKKICSCGNCGKNFLFKERKIKQRKVVNVVINESVCPFCESLGFTQESFEKWLTYKYEDLNW